MREPNHTCKHCGKRYWACNDCDKIHSWKAACCSFECYQKYVEDVLESRKPKVVKPVEPEKDEDVTTTIKVETKTSNKKTKKKPVKVVLDDSLTSDDK
jgi:hypothetical protein